MTFDAPAPHGELVQGANLYLGEPALGINARMQDDDRRAGEQPAGKKLLHERLQNDLRGGEIGIQRARMLERIDEIRGLARRRRLRFVADTRQPPLRLARDGCHRHGGHDAVGAHVAHR